MAPSQPPNANSWTAADLCRAAGEGDSARVQEILTAQPALAQQELAANDETRAIHAAARGNRPEVMRLLLEAGADPLVGIYPNREANGALTTARERGYDEVVRVIEEWLGEQRGTTSVGEEICAAADQGDHARVRELVEEDPASVNATDARRQTPLFKAVQRADASLVLELLDRGAEVDHRDASASRDDLGNRPIHYALNHSWKAPEGRYNTYSLIAGMLIARGTEYDAWVACGVGDVAGARRLLDAHPDRQALLSSERPAWSDYRNPLLVACFRGHAEVVRLLLDSGADPDAPFEMDVAGEMVPQFGHPLWLAACGNHYEVCELMLQRGARPNTECYASGSAVDAPLFQGHRRVANLLFRHGAVAIGLISYCVTNDLAAISEKLNGNPELEDELLWSAILGGSVELVRMVLDRNPEYDDDKWFNLLEQAVVGWRLLDLKVDNSGFDRRDYLRIMTMLLDHGVDPNLRYHRAGHTILHRIASDWGRGHTEEERIEFAGAALDHGADINARDDELLSTPLGWAARYGYAKLAEFLLDRGAALRLPEDEPWATPLAWAEKRGHGALAQLLRDRGATA